MDKMKEAEEAISKFKEKMENLQDKLFKLLKDNGVTEEMIEAAENSTVNNPFAEARDRLTRLADSLPDDTPSTMEKDAAGGGDEEQ
jgi:hypothetical protein